MTKTVPDTADVYIKQQGMAAAAVIRIGLETYDIARMSPSSQHTATFRAAITALASLPDKMEVVVHSDLDYLVSAMNDYVFKWQRNNWRKANGARPANLEEIRALLFHTSRLHSVTWVFERMDVPGHMWMAKHKAKHHLPSVVGKLGSDLSDLPDASWKEIGWLQYMRELGKRFDAYFRKMEDTDTALNPKSGQKWTDD